MISSKTLLAGILIVLAAGVVEGQKHGGPSPLDVKHYSYRDHILPILQAKCQPCHFEGGKVYGKLPFTDSTVVARLGPRLNTRLKDSIDQAIILTWSARSPAK